MSHAETVAELGLRINIIEEAYEFMLAYASQGLATDQGNDPGRQARDDALDVAKVWASRGPLRLTISAF